ncbi:hypothetical protein [uncultured Sphingomonas sp.]|uniref:hypothetical protein n=1 Tax=uncultured Sphingomonas sp. TaxID=158754 RepID=UPI0025F4914A|nr:hypothetical protein [uncultured Sphingomonas sp.]
MILPLIALLAATPQAEPSTDIFIGTIERDGDAIVLRRCDLAENRYTLVDAGGVQAMAKLRKAKLPAYGEVVAHAVEQGDGVILQVERVDKLTPGKSCHLADVLGKAG